MFEEKSGKWEMPEPAYKTYRDGASVIESAILPAGIDL